MAEPDHRAQRLTLSTSPVSDRPSGHRAFEHARDQFDEIAAQTGIDSFDYRIAGERFRLRFPRGFPYHRLTPAIRHLETDAGRDPGASGLCIDIWQSGQAPFQLTEREWNQALSPLAAIGPWPFVYCQADIGMLIAFRHDRALICFRDFDALPPWELAIPFRVVINAWFQMRGGQVLHAAALGDGHRAVLLAGRGGAGKSSTALACLDDPRVEYLADDLCLVTDPGTPAVHCLYNTAKIRSEGMHRFPELASVGSGDVPEDESKPTFYLYPERQDRLAAARPVAGILLPRIVRGGRTRVVPATSADAWMALVPSTFAVVLGDRKVAAERIQSLVQGLPVSWLELGDDRATIAAAVGDHLGSLDAHSPDVA